MQSVREIYISTLALQGLYLLQTRCIYHCQGALRLSQTQANRNHCAASLVAGARQWRLLAARVDIYGWNL